MITNISMIQKQNCEMGKMMEMEVGYTSKGICEEDKI